MTRCVQASKGTRNPGISNHGRVVIRDVPGSAKINRKGPGDEVTPSPIAAIKSTSPKAFQIQIAGRAIDILLNANHASGPAVRPTIISPQPAVGAKGAGNRPPAWRITK